MKKANSTLKKLTFILSICVLGISIKAQQSTTLYFMDAVPQSNQMNPATQHRCGFYLGLPYRSVSSSFELPVSFADIFYYDEEADSTRIFLKSEEKTDEFFDHLRKRSYFSAGQNLNLISFGFRTKKLYLSFDINTKMYSRFTVPTDFFAIPIQGKSGYNEIQFKDFGFDFRAYSELAVGVSRDFGSNLTLGARGKILIGHVDISSKNKDLSIETSPLSWTVNTDLAFNGSIPGLDPAFNDDGTLNIDSTEIGDIGVADLLGNRGLALDLGAHYKVMDRLILSASLLDLGYIRWKENTVNLTTSGSFVYEGVDADSIDSGTYAESLIDSLQGVFNIDATENAYTTFLSTKLYLGARYYLTPKVNVGILSRTELYKSKLRQQVSFSLNMNPLKLFGMSLSYSLLNGAHTNFGLGFTRKIGPFNGYVIFDNLPLVYAQEINTKIPIPTHFKEFNMRFGGNLIFGCKSKKKKMNKDKPLL